MALTGDIDNYPGFEDGVDGFTLGMKMQQGAERFGAKTEYAEVTGIKVRNVKTGVFTPLDCNGVFISIGRTPATEIFQEAAKLDENGYIIADESTRTTAAGVYAVGDVRTKALRQVVTAVSDGENVKRTP